MTVINKTDTGAVKKEPLLFKPVHEVIAVGFEWFCHKSVMFYIGMILFGVGSSFLIRYGMLNVTMTPEIAFSLIMFVCLSFLGMGWFLRKHRLYGLLFQSFAVGMLFLCLFAGMETFHIFSLWTGFGAMMLLCFISGALAVFQDARVIAVIGIGGGFLAPLLFPVANAATEFLLGYYLLLTAGVCWISSRRSWDELQYLSFGFSATVALIWGPVDYEFHHFMKFESFLIVFFLIYSAVMFHRFRTRPEEGDHPGKLIFSLILPVCFTFFQTGMARHIPHVMAATFALLSIFYSLQVGILYQSGQRPRRIVLFYFALAFIFGNLAIPFVFSPEHRMSGMILLFSWEAFLLIQAGHRIGTGFLLGLGLLLHGVSAALLGGASSFYAVGLLTAAAGGSACASAALSAYRLDKEWEGAAGLRTIMPAALLLWSLIIWTGAGYTIAIFHISAEFVNTAILFFFSGTAWMLYAFSRRFSWALPGKLIDYFYGPALALFALSDLVPDAYASHIPFDPAPFAWPVAVVSWYYILYLREKKAPETVHAYQHRFGLWFIVISVLVQVHRITGSAMPAGSVWAYSSVGFCMGTLSAMLIISGPRLRWPVMAHFHEYHIGGLLPLLTASWGWILWGTLSGGDPRPLPYFPLFNPLEISQAICLATLFLWKQEWLDCNPPSPFVPVFIRRHMPIALYGTLLICITSAVARGVTFFTVIHFDYDLFFSPRFHTSLSFVWSLLGWGVMYEATRTDNPRMWRMGSLLMFLVVIKLVLVDVFLSGGIARAFAFMWVGFLTTVAGHSFTGVSTEKNENSGEVPYGDVEAI